MSSRGATFPRWKSWNGLVYYGESVGFLCAWIVGVLALAYAADTPEPQQPPVERVAAADR